MFQVRFASPGSAHSSERRLAQLAFVQCRRAPALGGSAIAALRVEAIGMGGDVAEQVMSMCRSRLVLAEVERTVRAHLSARSKELDRPERLGACGPEAPVSRLPWGGLVAGYSSWKAPEQ